MTMPIRSRDWSLDAMQGVIRKHPEWAQEALEQEYKRTGGPRYTLIQWLKRHRLYNPTTRVIHKP